MQTLATVEKALDVLFHLHAASGARGVTEIGRELGLPKSSTHRVLTALARRGLVERSEDGRYRPGLVLATLGQAVLERDPVIAAARPELESEAEALGETLFLAAARDGHIRVLDKAEGAAFLRAAPRVGSEVPVHATAVGKLYLAFDPDQVATSSGRARRLTPNTRTGESLRREVEGVRRRGWAQNREEWMVGLRAVATPIRLGGRMVGTFALAAPTARLRDASRVARRLLGASRRIEARLEGRAS